MSDDMLRRIKRRNKTARPSVERDTSLIKPSDLTQPVQSSLPVSTQPLPTATAASSEVRSPVVAPTPSPAHQSAEIAPTQSAAAGATAIEAELATLPQVSQRRNIRLEVELESLLLSFCQENDITVETFLEACFVEAEQNARFKAEMVTEAQRRVQQRKQAGKLRRVLSQLKR
ncbi:hypothetical protein [cf. Phormidesmis sp. LEGE 11477]|uniref:hypothetical protein n=1 Tax=cf. Phormidesmis sp. LEGE 11477 TaxID=1828680 RepID=UPI00187ED7CF|nr:hypothetical protein [cf. Phormidesmis sp. LEGE 11477]MBE9064484.1 hypothetical protein [cf. Phormidesmis sp. LEGE 11477]